MPAPMPCAVMLDQAKRRSYQLLRYGVPVQIAAGPLLFERTRARPGLYHPMLAGLF